MGGARREEEKGFGEEGQGREEGEADVSPARIGGVLAGFWKRNRCGVTASCLPILVGPTILLPFKGLRAGGGSPSLSWECFRVSGWYKGRLVLVFPRTPGIQRHRSSGKEDKGDILVLGQGR